MLAQGAGFLNARAAVELATTFAENPVGAAWLDDLVDDYEATKALDRAVRRVSDRCRYLTAACSDEPGCFER